ncbi:MAG: hypothetical protein ABIF88_03730 [archaeon]
MPTRTIIRRRKKFPTFATIVLIFAIVWLLKELDILQMNIPWLPVILIIISLGWIFNRLV